MLALGRAVALGLGMAAVAGGSAAGALGPYFLAPFHVHRNAKTFGQSPTWTSRGEVLSNEPGRGGIEQVYVSRLNGAHMRCLTCGRLRGPNGFPAQRPEGDWILFCSMGAQPQHFGAPCLGGYGSDLYVMRRNATAITRLTAASDPAHGHRYDVSGGIPYDNYHPYWSPDGRHIEWTRTEAYPLAQGGQRWEMLLADFVAPLHGRPHLAHIRVVGPAFGVYETQGWAPDGSGFLFTAFGPRRSPFQTSPPGWMHLGLYFMRLYGRGASPAHPRVTALSGADPAYVEQATFTPDMREVIVMSSRATPGTWYQTVITAARWTRFDALDPGSSGGPMFLADFSDPRFTADLWMIDLSNGATRQLTNFHRVIPEFTWNFGHTRLLWSSNSRAERHFTWVAGFAGITAREREVPRSTPRRLNGVPIAMARVRGTTVPIVGLPGTPPAPGGLTAPGAGAGTQTLPPVVVSYGQLLLAQLGRLAALAGVRIGQPPF
jgi:WD40-like Beta Propeller Repeat